MKKIIFDGAYGIKSFGDDAPLIVLDELLKKRLGAIESVVVARHADENYYSRYGIRSISGLEYESKEESIGKWFRGFNPGDDKSDLNGLYNEIKSSDLLVLGAGNFLVDYTIDLLKGPIPRFLILSMMAKMTGTPIMWYGIAAGPIMTTIGKDMTRFSAMLATMITVRDASSIRELRKIGITKKINQLPDAVYGLKLPAKGHAKNNNTWQRVHDENRPVVVVSVRSLPDDGMISTSTYMSYIASFCDKIIEDYKFTILFIPQCIYEYGNLYEDDRNVAKEIIELMESKKHCYSVNEDIDIYDCVALYEDASVALCTRLHANVFAAMQGIPVIGLNYNPKVREFHRWLGTEEYVLDMNDMNVDNLVKSVINTKNNPEPFVIRTKKIFDEGICDVEKYVNYAIKAMSYSDSCSDSDQDIF